MKKGSRQKGVGKAGFGDQTLSREVGLGLRQANAVSRRAQCMRRRGEHC